MNRHLLKAMVFPIGVSLMLLYWHFAEGFIALDLRWWIWLAKSSVTEVGAPSSIVVSFWATAAILFVAAIVLRNAKGIGDTVISGNFSREEIQGSARWAHDREIRRAGLFVKEGVTVGLHKGKALRHDGPQHILCFAPTRSGKGISVVIPTLLEWKHSVVVLDIKGENFALTSGYREHLGQRVLYFAPASTNSGVRYNPLDQIRIGTVNEIRDAQNIAMMIVDPVGKGLENFWVKSGFEWMTAAILYVVNYQEIDTGRRANLADVKHFISGSSSDPKDRKPNQTMFQKMMETDFAQPAVNREIRARAKQMNARAPNELSGVLSESSIQLALYADPCIAANTEVSDFSFDDLVNAAEPYSVYIVIPPTEITRLQPLLKLFVTQLIQSLTSVEMQAKDGRAKTGHKRRLLLMLDEFAALGKMEVFEKALAFIAGYGLKACMIVQDTRQLKSIYGSHEGITPNCGLRIAFAPNTIDTANMLSAMVGATTIVIKKRTRSHTRGRDGRGQSEHFSDHSRPLITPDEVMRLAGAESNENHDVTKPADILLFPANCPPVRCQQRLFFLDKELQERSRMIVPQFQLLGNPAGLGEVGKNELPDLTKNASAVPNRQAQVNPFDEPQGEEAAYPADGFEGTEGDGAQGYTAEGGTAEGANIITVTGPGGGGSAEKGDEPAGREKKRTSRRPRSSAPRHLKDDGGRQMDEIHEAVERGDDRTRHMDEIHEAVEREEAHALGAGDNSHNIVFGKGR